MDTQVHTNTWIARIRTHKHALRQTIARIRRQKDTQKDTACVQIFQAHYLVKSSRLLKKRRQSHTHTHRHTPHQTGGRTDIDTDRLTHTHTHSNRDRHTHTQTNKKNTDAVAETDDRHIHK